MPSRILQRISQERCATVTYKPLLPSFSRSVGRNSENPYDSTCDIVQFTDPIVYVLETEQVLTVDVMRIGSMIGTVSMSYATEDGSAVGGKHYKPCSGEIVFESGQHIASIEIALIQTVYWNATLEFKIVLACPVDCEVGPYLGRCRVKLIDADDFPSSKYSNKLRNKGASSVHELGLLWEYLKLLYGWEGVPWRTWLNVFLDELDNMYFVLQVGLQMYLVNNVLHFNYDLKSQLLLHTRAQTAMLVGIIFFLPMILVIIADNIQKLMNLSGLIKETLQSNLFRKYMTYNSQSRLDVSIATVETAVTTLTTPLSQVYMSVLAMTKTSIRILMTFWFTTARNPGALWVVLSMPFFLLFFGGTRLRKVIRCRGLAAKADENLSACVHEACALYEIIADYKQRPQMEESLGALIREADNATTQAERVEMNNNLFARSLGPFFIGIYITVFAPHVIGGELSLGAFLAMIHVIQSVAMDWQSLFGSSMTILSVAGPLRKVTDLFNKETEIAPLMEMARNRHAETKTKRHTLMHHIGDDIPPVDLLNFEIVDMSFKYNDGPLLFEGVNMSIPQGQTIGLLGEHESGKKTLLKLFASRLFPTTGKIFFPTHLRVLHVCQEPMLLKRSVWKNLVFGHPQAEVERVKRLLHMMNMQTLLPWVETPEQREGDSSGKWMTHLSYTQQAKIGIARAMIMNPEVLILQRPLHHFQESAEPEVLHIIHNYVSRRGLCLPAETIEAIRRRRPRSCFMSLEERKKKFLRDMDSVLEISDTSVRVLQSKDSRAFSSNSIASSRSGLPTAWNETLAT